MVREITRRGYRVVQPSRATDWHFEGRHWPRSAETMVGLKRLRNIRECVEQVLEDQIPGDLIETGVWRGGSCIYMRAILAAHEISDRTVWVADSFEGLPPPTLPQDEAFDFHEFPELAVGVDEVRANFERYGLLDDQVRFLIGWFADTLPGPVKQLAVLRLDGDLYESTWDTMTALEPLVSPGGFVIIDDYGDIEACRKAVHDYRTNNEITSPIEQIDYSGVFWRKAPCRLQGLASDRTGHRPSSRHGVARNRIGITTSSGCPPWHTNHDEEEGHVCDRDRPAPRLSRRRGA